jgi:ferredoxin
MAADEESTARVSIDSSLCGGHGRCYEVAPSLFHPDGDGYGQVTVSPVRGADLALAERAAGLCPELAVRIESEKVSPVSRDGDPAAASRAAGRPAAKPGDLDAV